MAGKGETIHLGAPNYCDGDYGSSFDVKHPPVELVEEVLSTPAGYYIGTQCGYCGPVSRESHYYLTREQAQKALDMDAVDYRDSDFHG